MTSLDKFLQRHRRIALDTSVFIYYLEENPQYTALTDAVFAWLELPGRTAVTSTVTMTELLVKPYRTQNTEQVNQFYALLSTFPQLDWVAPTLPLADVAAGIRATHNLRTPDALQAATAIFSNATGLVTNDAAFQRVTAFETMLLGQG